MIKKHSCAESHMILHILDSGTCSHNCMRLKDEDADQDINEDADEDAVHRYIKSTSR